jgi:hypothetical protein
MLTPTQRATLSSALEGAETGDGDATQALYRALSDVMPFHTLNILTAARWLLRVDDAHRAAVEQERNALLAVLLRHKSDIQDEVLRLYPDKSDASKQQQGELLRRERVLVNILRDWDDLRDNFTTTIAALRQESPNE